MERLAPAAALALQSTFQWLFLAIGADAILTNCRYDMGPPCRDTSRPVATCPEQEKLIFNNVSPAQPHKNRG